MLRQTLLDHAPAVESYLARVDRELKPLPETERDIARRELRQHVDALIAAHVETGMSETEATHAALAQFGDARKIGNGLRREWRLSQRPFLQNDTFIATAWAVAAHLVTYFCAVVIAVSPSYGTWEREVALIRALFLFIAPLLAGVVSEWRAPGRGLRGLFFAFVANLVFGAGVFLYIESPVAFGGSWLSVLGVLLGGWLPVGALAVGMTAFLRQRRQRKLNAGNA